MTKRIMLISILLCLVLLSSCAKNYEEPGELPDTGDVEESLVKSNETDAPPVESTPDETSPQETTPPETNVPETTPAETDSTTVEGANLCPIHSIDFHSYTSEMIDYVGGQEQFIAWHDANMDKESGIEGCPYYPNIYRFINYFEIPKSDLEALCFAGPTYYYFDYNVELLYGSDFSAINQYYTSHSEREDYREKLASLGRIKLDILNYAMSSTDEKMSSFFDSHCDNNILDTINWSIADFVRETGISKSDIEALIYDITNIEYPGGTLILNCFDFDFDYLYSDDNTISNTENSKAHTIQKINEDLRFCQQSPINIPTNDVVAPETSIPETEVSETKAPETVPVDDTPAEYIISEDGSIIYTPKYYSGSYRGYDFVDYDDEKLGAMFKEMYPSKAYNENVNIELKFTAELDKTVYKAGDSFWISFEAVNIGEPFMFIDHYAGYFDSLLVHSDNSDYIFRSNFYFDGRDLPDADAFETLIETGETRVDAIPYIVTEDTPLGKYDLYVYFSGYVLKVNDALEIVE